MTDSFSDPGASDLAEDAQQLLLEVERDLPGAASVSANCRPPLDVVETAHSLEIVLDVPGVARESLRVAIRRSTLLIVGSKPSGPVDSVSRFHLAERTYGRFARAVRLVGAFDASRARAALGGGELRIVLPLIAERRGRAVTIPVERQ